MPWLIHLLIDSMAIRRLIERPEVDFLVTIKSIDSNLGIIHVLDVCRVEGHRIFLNHTRIEWIDRIRIDEVNRTGH